MLLLEFRDGKLVREFEIVLKDRQFVTFGRGAENNYQIFSDMRLMSKVQCTLERRGDNWLLHDGDLNPPKRSANGITCNGRRIDEPLLLMPGMKAEIFRRHTPDLPGQDDWIELYFKDIQAISNNSQAGTYTGNDNEQVVELINLLRSDVGASTDRIDKHDAFLGQIVQQLRALEIAREKEAKERAAERELNIRQSRLLARHDKMIARVGLFMAFCLVLAAVWSLSNGNENLAEKIISIVMALTGGGGGFVLLQKEGEVPPHE
jgi:hypothetical protein